LRINFVRMQLPPFPRRGFYRTALIAGILFASGVARGGGAITALVSGILFGVLFGMAAATVWMASLVEPIRSTIDRMPSWKAGVVVVLSVGLLTLTFMNPRIENAPLGPAVIWLLILAAPVFLIRWLKRPHTPPADSSGAAGG
jgi:hypothetical protein